MLDVLGTVVITAVIVINLVGFLGEARMTRTSRLFLAGAVGLWIGFAAMIAGAGLLTQARPLPGVFVVVPILAALVAVRFSPAARAALLSVPLPFLVALNIGRVFGAFFLLLAAAERLSGPFPYSAGWGDVITGAFALPALWLAVRASVAGDRWLALWNAFGALDLIVAVSLGLTSAPGSPVQIIHAGIGPAAVLGLPWSLIPTVLVPAYLIVHGLIAVQLRERAAQPRNSAAAIAGVR